MRKKGGAPAPPCFKNPFYLWSVFLNPGILFLSGSVPGRDDSLIIRGRRVYTGTGEVIDGRMVTRRQSGEHL